MKQLTVPSKFCILDGAALKWIAMLSMLIDHFNKGILLNLIVVREYSHPVLLFCNNLFEILGRIAFPIFLFLLTEGFLHTKSRKNYLLSLLGFGVLAEIPYDMFETGQFFEWNSQNMYFTLALALVTLCIVEKIMDKWQKKGLFLAVPVTLFFGWLASFLALDYHHYGVVIPVIFYLVRKHRTAASLLSYAVIIKELWSILGFSLLSLYNGQRGKINKWFCYAFYPAHLLIIGLVRIFLLKL